MHAHKTRAAEPATVPINPNEPPPRCLQICWWSSSVNRIERMMIDTVHKIWKILRRREEDGGKQPHLIIHENISVLNFQNNFFVKLGVFVCELNSEMWRGIKSASIRCNIALLWLMRGSALHKQNLPALPRCVCEFLQCLSTVMH